jgi:hypothetical protein
MPAGIAVSAKLAMAAMAAMGKARRRRRAARKDAEGTGFSW